MNYRMLMLPLAILISACAREQGMSEKNENSAVSGSNVARHPDRGGDSKTKYPTVPEELLKGVARTSLDSPNPTPAQLARRAKSIAVLKDLGLPHLETLPVVEDETAVKLRTAEDLAKRCLATTICAVKGETNDQEFVEELIAKYSAGTYFSAQEAEFVKSRDPKKQQLVDFSWRYECVHVFLWAMKTRDSVAAPNEICPVSEDMKLIKRIAATEFVAKAKLRSASEILDMADLYYHLHWAAIELRIKGKKSDAVDEGIIRERHRALNWLIRYLSQEWDDVTTDT